MRARGPQTSREDRMVCRMLRGLTLVAVAFSVTACVALLANVVGPEKPDGST